MARSSKKAVAAGRMAWAAISRAKAAGSGFGTKSALAMWKTSSNRSARPSRSSHPLGVDVVGVGEDQPPAGQPGDRGGQRRVVGEGLQREVVRSSAWNVVRVDAVVQHQPAQRQAVLVEVALLQRLGLVARQAGQALDVVGDPRRDLRRRGRISSG